jgi:hypothetical protein
MPKVIDLKELMRKNPHIDAEKLQASMELQERLRAGGVSRRDYELVPPFSGRQVQVMDRDIEKQDISHMNRP